MKKEKLYFCYEIDEEEMAHTKSYLIYEMKELGLHNITVSVAKRYLNTKYFFCKAVNEVCGVGVDHIPCGNECDDYEPRNGKSGCCRYRGFCYIPDENERYILKRNGRKIKMVTVEQNVNNQLKNI